MIALLAEHLSAAALPSPEQANAAQPLGVGHTELLASWCDRTLARKSAITSIAR